jgi:hypothetical protein
MQILCPYCHSEHVQRMLHSPAQASDDSSHLLGTSATLPVLVQAYPKAWVVRFQFHHGLGDSRSGDWWIV